jgi:hypothetical protein
LAERDSHGVLRSRRPVGSRLAEEKMLDRPK